jgi:hypothetical protein
MSPKAKTHRIQADANPTKEFFVSVLGKDISLIAAIIDLVDNCVDGARRTRPAASDSFDGLWIEIETDATRFSIKDNCGGISVDTAKTYAFRFGHPTTIALPDYATGQFGVGMKRALFKLGNHFTIESYTQSSAFSMDVPVDIWVKETGPRQCTRACQNPKKQDRYHDHGGFFAPYNH